MCRELVDPATAIGSSDGPMQKKCRHSKVKVRLFEPPEVPLESIDEWGDFDQHDMSEHDEQGDFDRHDMSEHDDSKPGTPYYDSGEEHSVGA